MCCLLLGYIAETFMICSYNVLLIGFFCIYTIAFEKNQDSPLMNALLINFGHILRLFGINV